MMDSLIDKMSNLRDIVRLQHDDANKHGAHACRIALRGIGEGVDELIADMKEISQKKSITPEEVERRMCRYGRARRNNDGSYVLCLNHAEMMKAMGDASTRKDEEPSCKPVVGYASPATPCEILDNKCPDCGADMVEVCSGLENLSRGDAASSCRHSDYCEKPIKSVISSESSVHLAVLEDIIRGRFELLGHENPVTSARIAMDAARAYIRASKPVFINQQTVSERAAAYCEAKGYKSGPTRKVAYIAFTEGAQYVR